MIKSAPTAQIAETCRLLADRAFRLRSAMKEHRLEGIHGPSFFRHRFPDRCFLSKLLFIGGSAEKRWRDSDGLIVAGDPLQVPGYPEIERKEGRRSVGPLFGATFTDSGRLSRIRGDFHGFGATFTDSGRLSRIRGDFHGFG
ncbi:MAG: hypothetical protein LKI80_14865, partial [Sporolactobacillus sp.]|nr:hypothetical protein [Sporolactobacillus sp.]